MIPSCDIWSPTVTKNKFLFPKRLETSKQLNETDNINVKKTYLKLIKKQKKIKTAKKHFYKITNNNIVVAQQY